ncbi:MAG: putative ABC transporter permease [Bacillota bacterium]|nr:putative ABC transporter permease [Bacillota bacterium]
MTIFYLFFIFSFLGWSIEVIYAYFKNKRFVNRGFLFSPICPIYGVGVVSIYISVKLINSFITFNNTFDIIIAFLIVTLVTSILEYITGDVLEKLFHTRWWDYSEQKLNFKGHICIKFSLIWGLAGTLVVYFIDFVVNNLNLNLDLQLINQITYILIFLFAVDLGYTLKSLVDFRKLILEFEKASLNYVEVKNMISEKKDVKMENLKIRLNKYHRLYEFKKKLDEFKEIKNGIYIKSLFQEKVNKYHNVLNRIVENRFFAAFPDMKFKLKEVKNNFKKK